MQNTINNETQIKIRKRILILVQFSILLAIEAVVCFSPLGSIPFTPVMVASIGMIPVIIAALLMGTLAGSLMGLFAGVFSLIVWVFTPPPSFLVLIFSPVASGSFWSVIFCLVPRILVGTVTGLLFAAFSKINKSGNKIAEIFAYAVSAAVGTFMNTALVLWGGYIVFKDQLSALFEGNQAIYDWLSSMINAVGGSFTPETAVWTALNILVLTNGVPELLLSAVVGYAVCKPVRYILKKQNML
jgi:uncharacterized membrane protein